MSREYAVVNAAGEKAEILFQTPDFRSDRVCDTAVLSGDLQLWITGDDALRQENERLVHQLQEAQDANTAKEVFLSNMSHDIRTPMNAIIGMTALAKKYIDEKARVSDALNKIEIASSHLLSLINDVLDMSRINSGRLSLSEELFSLGDLLHETLSIVRPQAEQHQHQFRFGTENIFAENLYGDPLRLRQIYVNIINNAIKYTNDGGDIQVFFSQEQLDERCLLVFRCRDNGLGMSEDFLKRIFVPFERVSSSTISRIEGTGLGMSIVKKLVDAMDGTIEIQSKPGEGTAVTIKTPLHYEQTQVDTSALENRRLLILEADALMQELYRRYLGETGLDFQIASSMSEAISALTDADFRGQSFDAVILGKTALQSGTVFEIADYLKKSYPELVLILISEDNWEEIEYRANRCGIEFFLPIPIFRKALLNGLNQALQTSDRQSGGPGSPDLSGKRILLAEDNDINREIACELLGSTNAAVDTAVNGQEALDLFTKSEPGWYDLILMDIQMPVMDGYTAAEKIRACPRADAGTVKIYAMSANAFAEDISRSRRAGMDGHIAKPIDINVLMQVLRQIQ